MSSREGIKGYNMEYTYKAIICSFLPLYHFISLMIVLCQTVLLTKFYDGILHQQ